MTLVLVLALSAVVGLSHSLYSPRTALLRTADGGGERKQASSLGRDPRGPLPDWATAEAIAELDAKSTSTPKPAAASKCAAISSIQTVSQLADAVSSAPLVVVKYYAPWCRLCLYVKPNFERVAKSAKERLAGAEFLEVDCGASRALVKLAGVSTLPCVHVYQGGELVSMHRIGKRQLFYEFEESIERLATYGV